MPILTQLESAAGNIKAGANLIAGHRLQAQPTRRVIKKVALVGSAVLRDAYVDIFVGSHYLGTFYPTTVGVVVPLEARDFIETDKNLVVERNELINVIVGSVSVTNAFLLQMVIENIE